MRLNRIDLVSLVAEAQALEDFEEALAAAACALPADPAAILDFFEIPTGDSFDVTPQQAVAFFKAKGLNPTFSFADMVDGEHSKAFTVAKMMDVDMLGQIRASLDSALANGTAFKDWADEITPLLQSAGWWGRKEVVDPLSGQTIVAQLGSPWRLETIFRTNMQSAYAAGAWQEIEAQKDVAPFLMYDAVDDFRTRPLHASWDRKVLPVKSPWWSDHYPPNGYNCRCGVIQLSGDEVEAMGLQITRDPPDDGSYKWVNPRTGLTYYVPNGIDPGFDNNVGKAYKYKLEETLGEKINTLPVDMAAAASKAASKQAAKIAEDATAAAKAAQAELASAQAKAALARAKALAEEKSKQWVAQQQIEAIAKGKETAGKGAAYKIKALAALKKSPAWLEARPAEQLQQVLGLADELKAKAELSSKLSLFKKAIVEGKTPAPAVLKAVNSLPEAEKAAVLKAADEAKAAAEAKKLAELAAKKPVEAKIVEGNPPNPATMQKIGEQKGSNPGGTYVDSDTGLQWYVKQPASSEIARNEVLAAKLYELAGIDVPELHLIELNGKASIASRIVDGLKKADSSVLAAAPGTAEGFAVDAWLSNWDVVGLGYDNLLTRGSRAFRVDTGGALRFRAQGGLKGSAFGPKVTEIDSLRDPSLNRQAQSVFGRLTQQQIEDSVVTVLKVDDEDIRALVERLGPLDAAERRLLADTLIARKRDLAARFPAAAQRARAGLPEPKPAGRVTAAEQAEVEASRVNGYAFPTDSDQVEDHSVLVHTFKRADGSDATRGFFKLLPGSSRELQQAIAATAGETPSIPLGGTRDSILAAVKSINYRADKGQPLDATVVGKIKTAAANIDASVRALKAAAAKAKDGAKLLQKADELEAWRKTLEPAFAAAQKGEHYVKLSRVFDTGAFPDSLDYDVKAATAATGPKWKKVTGTYTFNTSEFDRSFAKETNSKASVSGTSIRYEVELADGTRITYVPHDAGNAWAMQGIVKIDAPGRGMPSTERIFSAMAEIGLKSTRATEVDRKHLYLNAFARIRLIRTASLAEFEAIGNAGEEAVAKKLALIKRATGLEVDKSEGWKTLDGVRQAFGHGRAYQFRPDLAAADLEQFGKTHVVYHNPQGLGTDAGSGVFDRLKTVIDGGGMFASPTDRVRRGVPLAGSSVSSDLQTGGGDYHFTRIRPRASQGGTGVYWKTTVLRRMDAITYDSDNFGRTTAGHVEQYRLGQTIDSFRSVSGYSGNETIFKGGLSIFDDVDRIVLSSAAEVRDAIAWLKSRGYKTWPDGRALEDVILTKDKHRAKP